MPQFIRLIVVTLFIFSQAYGTTVAVLFTPADNSEIISGIVSELKKNGSAKAFPIRSTYDISKVLSRKPDAIILVSDTTIRTYTRFSPKQEKEIPTIAISSYDSYQALKNTLPEARFCVKTVSTNELFRQLSKFTGTIYPSAGFLYNPSKKQAIANEMAQLRKNGIIPFSRAIPDSASEKEISDAMKILSEQGVTTIRIAISDSNYSVFKNSGKLQQECAERFSVVLSDRENFNTTVTQTPTVTIESDNALFSRTIALITIAAMSGSPLENDLTISTEIGSLRYGTEKNERITESRATFMASLDSILRSAGKSVTGDSLRSELERKLKPITEIGITVITEQMAQMAETGTGLNRKVLFSFTIRDTIIAFCSLFIVLAIVHRTIQLLRRFSNRSVAILYPESLQSMKIEREGKPAKRLDLILKAKGYSIRPIQSLMKYRNYLHRNIAEMHIIEWSEGSDVIVYLQHIFDKRDEDQTEPVVIFNIAKRFQLELKPRFSRTPLFLFEQVPTRRDLERVFYGRGHHEFHLSSIAGSLAEESLPQILQVLEINRVTGALLVEDPSPFSIIFYRDGLVVHAQDRFASTVEESLYNTLNKREGSFRFEKNRRSPIEKTALNSMDILMNWSAGIDGTAS